MAGEPKNEALAAIADEANNDNDEAVSGETAGTSAPLMKRARVVQPGDVVANDARADRAPEGESATVVEVSPDVVPEPSNSIVPPPRPGAISGAVQGSRRWIFIAKHYTWTSVRSLRWWILLGLIGAQLAAVLVPMLQLGIRTMSLSFLTLVAARSVKAWKDSQPASRQIVDRNYDERKLAEYKLVHVLSAKELMTPPQVAAYQREVLELIAAYVRDHRRDWSKPTIFACLLVDRGDELEVIARDHDHRQGGVRYRKAGMLAARALAQGSAVLTGDLYRDYPDTPKGKPYCSVLAIPVHRDGEVVGVISIDSSQKFHFDLTGSKLVDHLMPYIAFLAWTLPKGRKALYLPVPGADR